MKFIENVVQSVDVNKECDQKYEDDSHLSMRKADDFWKNEFAHNEIEIDEKTYSELLEKAFNCSEEDVSIDFHLDERIIQMLDSNGEKWNQMNNTERLDAMNDIASIVAEKIGLPQCPKVSISELGESTYGYYDKEREKIVINKAFLNDFKETLNTLMHELWHVFQHFRAEQGDDMKDALYQVGFENYIEPIPLPGGGFLFFWDYSHQFIEVEARVFANMFSEVMKNE